MAVTSRSETPVVQPPEQLRADVSALVAAEGGGWFAEPAGPLTVRFVGGVERARCFLYRFELSDGRRTRQVMVKVRHSRPELRRRSGVEDRPILAPVRSTSDEDAARREYEGLRHLADALRGQDPRRFGVLTPLALLPEHAAVVTEVVHEPTLRARLVRSSRLRHGGRSRLGTTPWENAGAALRLFHGQPTSLVLTPAGETPERIGALLRQFADFLRDRIGERDVLREVSTSAPELARRFLPRELPLGTSHADFTATNIFTNDAGRVTVFDPMPVWRFPVYQDVATLIVGARVHPFQAATLGLAFPQDALDEYEAAVLDGYFDGRPVPYRALAVVELMVLMDRWAALVDQRTQRGRVRDQLQDARIRASSHHYAAEARRLYGRAVNGH